MTTKFIHIRWVNYLTGQLLPHGGVTIAYEVDANSIAYSYARCSRKDNYNKAIGRAVAKGRLDLNRRIRIIPQNADEPVYQQVWRDFDKEHQ